MREIDFDDDNGNFNDNDLPRIEIILRNYFKR